MGDNMNKHSDYQLRHIFFYGPVSASNLHATEWAKNRIEHLEKNACDMGELLERMGKLLERREEEIASLQSQLQGRNVTIDGLEDEIKLSQAAASQITGSTSQESDEDLHQRHRRERMMDEVTLICVRGGIEQVDSGRAPEKTWGRLARDSAENICDGIMEFDAKQ
jgi:hypothetical protein